MCLGTFYLKLKYLPSADLSSKKKMVMAFYMRKLNI